MPTLHWIGKEKVINHHRDVPFKVLEHKYGFENGVQSDNPTHSGNVIIHGDNLEALKALLPQYEGKIDCIYIDPPYNTGNENWVYNDNVNHPKIKKWLGEVVGKEGDDLSRHDKWLCMMYPRLKLLHQLLSDKGAIFISIDDNEINTLKLACDEIFGRSNFVTNFIWERKKKPAFLSKQVGSITEYVICFAKNYNQLDSFTSVSFKTTEGKKYPFNNAGNGVKILKFPPLSVRFDINYDFVCAQDMSGGNIITKLLDDINIVNGYNINEFRLEGEWRYSQIKLNQIIENGESILISKIPFRPNHLKTGGDDKKIHNFLSFRTYEIGTNEDASADLIEIFDSKIFDFSKPKTLIEFLLEVSSSKNSIILDSFAGSGTTAHAVLNLNKKDGGNRKFICIEMEDYAETITSERVKRVIKGYGSGAKKVEGTGGSFDFYALGQPIFVGENNEYLNEEIDLEKIKEYIWYSETRSAYIKSSTEYSSYFLGKKEDTAYYFIYEKEAETTLDYDSLSEVKTRSQQYVIYADNCLLSKEFMMTNNIIFKKIPRDVTRF